MPDQETITLKVVPNFFTGYTYLWELTPDFQGPLPWVFSIEKADVPYMPDIEWVRVSTDMTNVFAFVDSQVAVYTKEYADQYRVKLVSGGKTYYSRPHTIFSDIPRDSWLIIREIQRKEVLDMRAKAGTPCQLWQRMQSGVKCTHCADPMTGQVLDPDCAWCMGTGKLGGYHGPYPAWGKFGSFVRQRTYGETEVGVMTDVRLSTVRFIGNPHIFQKDVIRDTTSDRMYVVNKVEPILELRRMTVIQNLFIDERAAQDILHKLGTDTPLGESTC